MILDMSQLHIGDTVTRRSMTPGPNAGGPVVPVGTTGIILDYQREEFVIMWDGIGVVSIPDADIRCGKHRRNRARVCNSECNHYGVFPHAEWHNGAVVETKRGYVVRQLDSGVPYSRMIPVKTFARRADADKLSDKMSGY